MSDEQGFMCRCGHHFSQHEVVEAPDANGDLEVLTWCLSCRCSIYEAEAAAAS